jgi:sugar fermentation stimulation protein A
MPSFLEQESLPPRGPGTYLLFLALSDERDIRVGALGRVRFRAGHYVYVGSALGGLAGRLARHLRHRKRAHWHIDHLLQHATISQMWWHAGGERLECVWALNVAKWPGAQMVAVRLGASDCSCRSHLFHLEGLPSLEEAAPSLCHAEPLGWTTPTSVADWA